MSRLWHLVMPVVAAAVFLPACSSVYTPPSGSPPNEELVTKDPPERTWDAVVDYFASNNIRVHNEIRGETVWTMYAEQPEFKGGYLDEYVDLGKIDGRPVSSMEGEDGVTIVASATYNVTMHKGTEEQRVVVNTTWDGTYTGQGKFMPGATVIQLKGVSKGRLEQEVLRDIRRKLREMRAGTF